MTEPEFREWLAYDRVEPLPDAHWDAALVAWTVARAMGGNRKAKLEDFLPRRGGPKAGPKGPAVLGVFAEIRAMARAADEERKRREG